MSFQLGWSSNPAGRARRGVARAAQGTALVNINENTSAAPDGDAKAHARETANALQLL